MNRIDRIAEWQNIPPGWEVIRSDYDMGEPSPGVVEKAIALAATANADDHGKKLVIEIDGRVRLAGEHNSLGQIGPTRTSKVLERNLSNEVWAARICHLPGEEEDIQRLNAEFVQIELERLKAELEAHLK